MIGKFRDRDRDRDRYKRYHSPDRDDRSDSYDTDVGNNESYHNQTPNNTIIVRGLAQHITEADVSLKYIHDKCSEIYLNFKLL